MNEMHREMAKSYEEQAKRILEKIDEVEPGTQEYKELQSNLKNCQEMADENAKILIMEKRARKWPDLAVKIGLGALSAVCLLKMYQLERNPDSGVMFRGNYTNHAMRIGGL